MTSTHRLSAPTFTCAIHHDCAHIALLAQSQPPPRPAGERRPARDCTGRTLWSGIGVVAFAVVALLGSLP